MIISSCIKRLNTTNRRLSFISYDENYKCDVEDQKTERRQGHIAQKINVDELEKYFWHDIILGELFTDRIRKTHRRYSYNKATMTFMKLAKKLYPIVR